MEETSERHQEKLWTASCCLELWYFRHIPNQLSSSHIWVLVFFFFSFLFFFLTSLNLIFAAFPMAHVTEMLVQLQAGRSWSEVPRTHWRKAIKKKKVFCRTLQLHESFSESLYFTNLLLEGYCAVQNCQGIRRLLSGSFTLHICCLCSIPKYEDTRTNFSIPFSACSNLNTFIVKHASSGNLSSCADLLFCGENMRDFCILAPLSTSSVNLWPTILTLENYVTFALSHFQDSSSYYSKT